MDPCSIFRVDSASAIGSAWERAFAKLLPSFLSKFSLSLVAGLFVKLFAEDDHQEFGEIEANRSFDH